MQTKSTATDAIKHAWIFFHHFATGAWVVGIIIQRGTIYAWQIHMKKNNESIKERRLSALPECAGIERA